MTRKSWDAVKQNNQTANQSNKLFSFFSANVISEMLID